MENTPGALHQPIFQGHKLTEGNDINTGGDQTVKSKVIDGLVKAPHTTARGLHERGQKAQTLMRGALKKPTGSLNKIQNLRPGFNPERELRARRTIRHSKIDRFGSMVASQKPAFNHSPATPLQGEAIKRQTPKRSSTAAPAAVMPSLVTSASHQRLERMLDQALTSADAHKQALKYEAARHFWQKPGFFSRRRGMKIGIVGLLILGTSAIIAWQKIPALSVKLADMRTHLDASIPSYQPAGYVVSGPAKVINKAVAIQYASTDDKSKVYTVSEQPSNQDSTSLIADNSSPSQTVQTAQANGIPLLIIKNEVKCVSNGIETTITNKADLAPNELLNIAKSVCS